MEQAARPCVCVHVASGTKGQWGSEGSGDYRSERELELEGENIKEQTLIMNPNKQVQTPERYVETHWLSL